MTSGFKASLKVALKVQDNHIGQVKEHFLLLCPSFDDQRRDLLAGIEELLRPFVQIANLSNDALTQLLLYSDKDLSYEMNSDILRLTIHFIRETGRFD